MPHVSCLFKKGVETFINIRLIKRQNPMECIVHFGKSFTQPIPKIINIEAIELIKKEVQNISFTSLYSNSHDIPNNKIGMVAKKDVLVNFNVFMSFI